MRFLYITLIVIVVVGSIGVVFLQRGFLQLKPPTSTFQSSDDLDNPFASFMSENSFVAKDSLL